MYELKKVKHKYSKTEVLKGIDIKFYENKLTTILGVNGAGKTTLIKSMMKLVKPNEGQILFNKQEIKFFKTKEYAKKVAYVPQQIIYPEGTSVYDFVGFGRNPYTNIIGTLSKSDNSKIEEALKICGISDYSEKEVLSLSGGQRQLCAVALTVAQDSDVILLDEPNSYLDIYNVDEIMHVLKHLVTNHKKTIIMTTHDINQASKFSDYIVMMKNGKIFIHDKPKNVITEKNLLECYSVNATIQDVLGKPIIIDYRKKEKKNEV